MAKVDKSIAFEKVIKNVRLSFPALFTPEPGENGGKPRYKASFLLDPSLPEHLEIIKELRAEFKKMWCKMLDKADAKPPADKVALKKGDDKNYDGYAGMWFISGARAESQGRPSLLGYGGKNDPLPSDSTKMYAGCYVHPKLRFYGHWHEKSGFRINCSIEAVMLSTKKGSPFGAGETNLDDMPDNDDLPDSDDLDDDIDDDLE